jgi:hypothetical protein
MSRQSTVEDVFEGIHKGIYDGETPFSEDLREAIAPGESYSRLLATELPSLHPHTQVMIVLEFAMAGHPEVLPHAERLLNSDHASTRFQAALSLALLGDLRGAAEIRRQIARPEPGMILAHIIDYLEEATLNGQHPEFQPLLAQARSARSKGGG